MAELIDAICHKCWKAWATWRITFTVPFWPDRSFDTIRCDACAKRPLWPSRERGRVRIVPPNRPVPIYPKREPRPKAERKPRPRIPWVDDY